MYFVPLILALAAGLSAQAGTKPNIVFVLADDLGWRDCGFTGATFYETPHLDRLAKDGMIFDRAYTCGPNCAPTRASLISGMYGPRHHIYTPGGKSKGPLQYMRLRVPARAAKSPVTFPPSKLALEPSVVSFAELVKSAGYKTAHFGKWHLGPDAQGFDVYGSDGTPGKRKQHYGSPVVADKLTDASVEFIEANKDRPFLLYLAHWDVHTPIRAKQEVVDRYKQKLEKLDEEWNATYAAMIEAVDKSVGRVRAKLEELDIAKNTLFVFSSDNGGLPNITKNQPLHGGKGSLFEGGIRVPTCMTWPGVIEAGSRCNVPITSVDFLPTFAELAGAELPSQQPVDGRSLVPLLSGKQALGDRSIFWFYPLYLSGGAGNRVVPVHGTKTMFWRGVPAAAIVKGKWKLIRYFESKKQVLFDVEADIGESKDLAGERTDKRDELAGELDAWLQATKAPVPTEVNPDFDNTNVRAGGGRRRR